MRLTHIKLAGFKSFVEPTHIPVPGQLVAVCGPNGCGKSNVIDAVRWVLGESSAKQLRGESMQDVIFNGSDQRKPGGRASVELVFDNSLGRASGPWSHYAEISIKRVLTRAGDSSYYINNQAVRRRDITDLFLGTGVGARGYAVIEQGMISRIIEARPEELRLFLEEAAGVSKYKERRRETESRLHDARENLLRLDDIRSELNQQVEKLEAQAEVARRYLELSAEKNKTEQKLALVRLLEAEREQTRWQQEGEQLAIAFEQAVAGLRAFESELEALREQHFSASDGLHIEQGKLYEINAKLARLEQQLTHLRESRERLGRQIEQDKRELGQNDQQRAAALLEQDQLKQELIRSAEQIAMSERELSARQAQLPDIEASWRQEQQRQQQLQQRVHEGQRQVDRLQSALNHLTQHLNTLQLREVKLRDELRLGNPAAAPDGGLLQMDFQQAEATLLGQRQALEIAIEGVRQSRQLKADVEEHLSQLRQHEATVKARGETLGALVQAQHSGERLAAWLQAQGWAEAPLLFERLTISPGWETAVEQALSECLSARVLDSFPDAFDSLQPPAKLAVVWPVALTETRAALPADFYPLADRIDAPPALQDLVNSLLERYCRVETPLDARAACERLPAGYVLVLANGHRYERGGVRLHAVQEESLLLRKAELTRLQAQLEATVAERQAQQRAVAEAETELQNALQHRGLEERELKQAELRYQDARIALARHEESQRAAAARHRQLDAELEEIEIERETLALQRDETEQQLLTARDEALTTQAEWEEFRHLKVEAEVALDLQRSALRHAEREHQESLFQQRLLDQKRLELQRRVSQVDDQIAALRERLETAQMELEALDPMQFDEQIQGAMEARLEQERVLAETRDRVNHLAQTLRETEEARTRSEQGLEPLRQSIQSLQLKEQEARLNAERQREMLLDVDRAALEAELVPDLKPAGLAAALTRLGNAIDALGAVNLAAVDELGAASERKIWLDEQAQDLITAIDTLSDAIARIDIETRDRLLATYTEVNRNLSELFPTLFGGGRAELVLTGEEILDAGLQIVAQPPGKKNSTISLLSGGEKALTALSLVFALFRLNPAPFCLLDEVDAPLDDANTGRFCDLVKKMSEQTQFLYISHNRITMEMAEQLIGITMQEKGVSRMVAVDIEQALTLAGV